MTGVAGLRLVFAGTPVFAERALTRLLASRHAVVAVMTQPDRPAGRGQKTVPSPVKQAAIAAGLPVLQPPSLRLRTAPVDESATDAVSRAERNAGVDAALQALARLAPDVMVVAAYGLILPPAVLELPRLGCLNIHASLLPRWRGAAPIIRAIEAGDGETGICIMRMDAGLDTGPVGLVRRTPIGPTESAGSLHDRLAAIGAEAIVEALDRFTGVSAHGGGSEPALTFEPQPTIGVTYAAKIEKAEARVDWRAPAAVVARRIRAFDPQPGAHTALARAADLPLRLFDAVVAPDAGTAAGPDAGRAPERRAGVVLHCSNDGLVVACGSGAVRIGSAQRAGGRRLPIGEFVRGSPLSAGDAFV